MSDNNPDDSMEPMPVDAPQEQTPTTSNASSYHNIDGLLSQVINLNNDHVLHESTCLICSHPQLRKEAEDLYDDGRKKEIVALFNSRTSVTISDDVVENHMRHHKDQAIQELQKVEYVDRISRLSGSNMTTLDRIEMCLSILTDQLMSINSLVPSGDKSQAEIKKLKASETDRLMKTFGTFLKLEAQIKGELQASGEIITIQKNKFVGVFQDAIVDAQNDRERQIIRRILNGLKGVDE
jgi:hypothetical protein